MIYESLFSFDAQHVSHHELLCGIDEAGRGPLAGPVVCAAVILNPNMRYDALTDSKKISEKKRDLLYENITQSARFFTTSVIDHEIIDNINILRATMLGMRQCIERLPKFPHVILVDGSQSPAEQPNIRTVIGGDGLSATVAAASIVAKVTRDRIMREYGTAYPEYGFGKHKGYPTKEHYNAVSLFGLSGIHRKCFFARNEEIMFRENQGAAGENFASQYLLEQGYEIRAKNYRSRYGEIDIIAQDDRYIVFVEVKTRAQHAVVSGVQSVHAQKQRRILNTAALYLQQVVTNRQPRFDVIEVRYNNGQFAVFAHHENAFDARAMGD